MSGVLRKAADVSRYLVLPALFAVFIAIMLTHGPALNAWLPHWDALMMIGTVTLVERVYTYKNRVSQRGVFVRDVTSTFVNVFLTGAALAFVVLPLLDSAMRRTIGRKYFFEADTLGPVWLQVVTIVLVISFFRYWIHRLQHHNEFLWSLHSYHHSVTDLRAMNDFTSNPVDFALRNVLIYLLLSPIGFDSTAFFIAFPMLAIWGVFSHCGAEVKGGWLNYVFAMPEVHRWHHTSVVPEGYSYSVNYGVELSFWDLLFGTYYAPGKDGQIMAPRIGHPGGLPDEPNYLKVLLVPFGLYGIVSRLGRVLPGTAKDQMPAE